MFFTIKESFETALKRRQKERLEAASQRKKLEEQEREKKTEIISKKESGRESARRGRMSSNVATPGRSMSGTPKFAPKKRGRIGF